MVQLRPTILLASTALALLSGAVSPSRAQQALVGVPALAGATARVTGALSVRETGPLGREFEITMSDLATGTPLIDFEEELTQELHVIAVDSALSTFVHEHAEEAGAPTDGSASRFISQILACTTSMRMRRPPAWASRYSGSTFPLARPRRRLRPPSRRRWQALSDLRMDPTPSNWTPQLSRPERNRS